MGYVDRWHPYWHPYYDETGRNFRDCMPGDVISTTQDARYFLAAQHRPEENIGLHPEDLFEDEYERG